MARLRGVTNHSTRKPDLGNASVGIERATSGPCVSAGLVSCPAQKARDYELLHCHPIPAA